MKKPTLYKILNPSGKAHFADFTYKPYLPNGTAGKWTPEIEGKLQRCVRGYHLTETPEKWLYYFEGKYKIYVAEGRGERVYVRPNNREPKRVFRSIRLIRQVTRKEVREIRAGLFP